LGQTFGTSTKEKPPRRNLGGELENGVASAVRLHQERAPAVWAVGVCTFRIDTTS